MTKLAPNGQIIEGITRIHHQVDRLVDVRDLQHQLKAQGVTFQQEADESTTGPASFIAVDPDGNPLLFDQHV